MGRVAAGGAFCVRSSAMSLRRWIASAWSLRRILRSLSGIEAQLAQQNVLLARLADHFAPRLEAVPQAEVVTQSGVDHLDETELAIALAYQDRTRLATGHTPDDEEILTYLADEKTVDLHQRLIAREQELEDRRTRRREA